MSIFDKIVTASATVEPLPMKASKVYGTYTAFAVATVLNETLVALGYADQQIVSQRMYGYAKQGMIDGQRYTHLTGVVFNEADVINFVARYIARVQKNASK